MALQSTAWGNKATKVSKRYARAKQVSTFIEQEGLTYKEAYNLLEDVKQSLDKSYEVNLDTKANTKDFYK